MRSRFRLRFPVAPGDPATRARRRKPRWRATGRRRTTAPERQPGEDPEEPPFTSEYSLPFEGEPAQQQQAMMQQQQAMQDPALQLQMQELHLKAQELQRKEMDSQRDFQIAQEKIKLEQARLLADAEKERMRLA